MQISRFTQAGCVLAEDLGSNNSSLTYTGTGLTNSPYGRARTFNGTSDYVDIPDDNIEFEGGQPFSIIAKVKYTGTSGYPRIVGMDTGGSFNTTNGYRLWVGDDLDLGFAFTYGDATNYGEIKVGSMPSEGWHTVVATYDGSKIELFVDGVSKDSVVVGIVNPDWSSVDGKIGAKQTGSNLFQGQIKEVIIDDRAWTQQEITNYHENKVFDYDKNIVSRYNLDSTTTIKDIGWKENGIDGTVVGTPTLVDTEVGKGLNLNGSTDYVTSSLTCSESTILASINIPSSSTTLTMSLWSFGAAHGRLFTVSGTFRVAAGPGFGGFDTGVAVASYTGNHIFGVTINSSCEITSFSIDGRILWTGTTVTSGTAGTLSIGSRLSGTYGLFLNATVSKLIVFNKQLSSTEQRDCTKRILRGEL